MGGMQVGIVTRRYLKISLPLTNEQHGLGTSRLEQGLDPLRLTAVQGWCCFDARLQKWCVLFLTSQLAPFWLRHASRRALVGAFAGLRVIGTGIASRCSHTWRAELRRPHTNFLTSETGLHAHGTNSTPLPFLLDVSYVIEMEDAHTINLAMTKHGKKAFFGVYDGHNGDICAHWSAEHVWQYVDKLEEFNTTTLKTACLEADKEFLDNDPDSYVSVAQGYMTHAFDLKPNN